MHALLMTAALLSAPQDTAKILKAIDNICGDTWCEGDFSFRFDKVILDTGRNSTRVLFNMSKPGSFELSEQASILTQSFNVSCTISGYSSYTGIIDEDDQLNWDFYMGMTQCIQSLEERLNKIGSPG